MVKDMLDFKQFLNEEGAKLKHIHHAEDRPLMHGSAGFEHAHAALMAAHDHMTSKSKSSKVTMKYDGSPSIVFGHHPKTGKFFVASKSAFNKNPKINHTHADIDKNHGHAPGLVSKLKTALDHLPKVTPKKGVYQGDLMHTKEDHKIHEELISESSVSFTPNTITYTAHGKDAEAIKKSKIGVVVHTKYTGSDIHNMSAHHEVDHENFKHHSDVHIHGAEHDTSKIDYNKNEQDTFHKHMAAAKAIHDKHGHKMYDATKKHQGETGHMSTYINKTVRNDEKPTASGLQHHIQSQYDKAAEKLKSPAGKEKRQAEAKEHIKHIEKNKSHYNNILKMHNHLQQAKNTLVHNLEKHEGGYEHHIDGKKSKPEGFVVHHANEPTKLVNRAEFAKANLLKVR
jgi:hypothetical protein